jgi:hypothetical protein
VTPGLLPVAASPTHRNRSMVAAITLILIGALLLLSNLGYLNLAQLKDVLHVWWPVILIAVGIGMFISRRPRDRR